MTSHGQRCLLKPSTSFTASSSSWWPNDSDSSWSMVSFPTLTGATPLNALMACKSEADSSISSGWHTCRPHILFQSIVTGWVNFADHYDGFSWHSKCSDESSEFLIPSLESRWKAVSTDTKSKSSKRVETAWTNVHKPTFYINFREVSSRSRQPLHSWSWVL